MFISIKKMRELDLENKIEYNEDEDDVSDPDEDETNDLIVTKSQASIQVSEEYILNISATRESDPTVAVGLSKSTCVAYKLSDGQFAEICTLKEPKVDGAVTDCKFSPADSNLVYVGTTDGIKLWDLRKPDNPSVSFRDSTGNPKPLTCFDVSSNNRLISAGSNLFEGDAFILFWDIRKTNLLGGYWESHTDDITQVKFHPDDMNKLISGSVDGLINVYDLSLPCEDDALMDTLNTESSIEKLSWYTESAKEAISCVTHTADLQLWHVDGAEPYKNYSRKELAKVIRKKHDEFLYIANCHQDHDSQLVLVGSNHKKGECIRAAAVNKKGVSTIWDLRNNSQRVRCSFFNENTNILLSGGENGLLRAWQLLKPK